MELEFVAAPTGGGVVASMVGYRTSGQVPSLHRGVPSPYLTFILNLDTPIVTGTRPDAERDGAAEAYDNILAGLHTSPAYLFQPERQAGIQLAIHPLASRRVFGLPAAELSGLGDEASDVLGEAIRRTRDRACDTEDWQERFGFVSRYLRDRASAAPSSMAPRPEVVAAWRWMTEHGGSGRMDDLAAHVLMSPRQLTELFTAEVGLPPKTVNRLIRFDLARRRIQQRATAGAGLALSDVAHTAGYYDHAHLARDFQDFLGCSPTEWLAEEGANIQAGSAGQGEESVP